MKFFSSNFAKIIEKEFGQAPVWLPIFFVFGIIFYFSLESEPSFFIFTNVVILLISSILLLRVQKNPLQKSLLIIISFILGGFVVAFCKTHLIKHENFEFLPNHFYNITGKIKEIKFQEDKCRYEIKIHKIMNLANSPLPRNIQISDESCQLKNFQIGDQINFEAKLHGKFALNSLPNNHDFQRQIFFKKIDAFAKFDISTKIVKLNQTSSLTNFIDNARLTLFRQMTESMGAFHANIASSLIIGRIADFDETTQNNIQNSGLAHLFAISGLHISLVSLIFFVFLRKFLTIFPSFHLNHNIKKIAAIISIIASFFYLLLTNCPISAQRAFLMSSLIFLAIIFDLTPNPFRIISFVAFFMLFFFPEAIFDVGFQMSFLSVLSLIATYEFFTKHFHNQGNFLKKIFIYFLGIIFSSIIASLATLPLSAFYFKTYNLYGIISNLFAIPLTSFIIMPLAILAVICAIFGSSHFFYLLLKKAINLLLEIASFTVSLKSTEPDFSPFSLNPLTPEALSLIIFGMIWFCLWRSKLRFFAPVFMLPAFFLFQNNEIDLIIDSRSKNILFRKDESHFETFFQTPEVKIKEIEKIIQHKNLAEGFANPNIIINAKRNKQKTNIHNLSAILKCSNQKIEITQNDLKLFGTHVISFKKDHCVVTKTSPNQRFW